VAALPQLTDLAREKRGDRLEPGTAISTGSNASRTAIGIVSAEQGSRANEQRIARPEHVVRVEAAAATYSAVDYGSNSGWTGRSWRTPWRSRSAIRVASA
jgi:hypothetical protein